MEIELDEGGSGEPNRLAAAKEQLLDKPSHKIWKDKLIRVIREQLQLILTVTSVLVGVLIGIVCSTTGISEAGAAVLGFPGEILMRLLRMLVRTKHIEL
jgi:hypothetical protein